MPPKFPAKRRNDGESSGGRAPKKGGGSKEPTYDTYDEAMEGAISTEEKGERYRDGEKAQRFYEKAAELYQKALQFDGDSFDAMYNLARVQYILASEFLLPPSNMDLYTSAMALYNRALQGTDHPMLKADAAFNLAQTFSAVADITDEYQGVEGAENARELRVAASQLLGPVLATQIAAVQTQQEKKDVETASEAAGAASEAPAAAGEVEMSAEGGEKAAAVAEGEGEGEDDDDDEPLPTPDALVDTVLLLVDIGCTLWDSVTPPQPPSEGEQQATREMLDMAGQLGPSGRQAELDLAQIKVLLTLDSIMWDMYRESVQPGSGLERSPAAAAKALERLLESLETSPAADSTVKADILSTLASTEMAGAQRYATLAARSTTPAPLAQSAWALLASSTQHLTDSTNLPTTATTPKEYRPNCFIELIKATLGRARLSPWNETAAANAQQLMDNCSAYAGKAAQALGWNFPRLPTSTSTTAFYNDSLNPPYPAGWDMEMLARTLALVSLRVCYFASRGGVLANVAGAKESYEHAAKSLVDAIVSVPHGPRRLLPKDVARFIGDIEDEEGGLAEQEVEWWNEVQLGIRRGLDDEGPTQDIM